MGNDIKKMWSGLQVGQKLAIVVLVIATAVAISYFVAKSTEPNWAVLYSDLTENDTAAVVENLKKSGFQYKLSDDKTSIMVPADQKDDLRLMIAENDIIQDGNPGFELLDKMQLGATDFQNKLTKQRIFQGELTRTIEKIRGVTKARVQLADPDRSVFDREDEKPTASVMLILEPGVTLKKDQVKSIKNLVAFSVPRMTPDKVFVSDQNGNVLSEDIQENSSDIQSYRANYEKETTEKVQKVLEKIVGTKNVNVQVSAEMNFDSAKATIERYIPAEGAKTPEGIVSQTQTNSERYDKGKQQGVVQNTNDNKTNYEKVSSTNNYNLSKEIKQVVYAPGTVSRMTIAVALNKILTSKEKDELKNLVISASGANPERGDVVNITSMEFQSIADDEAQAAASAKASVDEQKQDMIDFVGSKVFPSIVILVLGLGALYILNSILNRPIQGQEVYNDYEEEEDYYVEDHHEAPELIVEKKPAPVIEAKLAPEVEKMRDEINSTVVNDPDEASRLILSFIKE